MPEKPDSLTNEKSQFRPMSLPLAIILFGASAFIFRLCVYNLMLGLMRSGVVPFWSFIASYSLVLVLMAVASLVGFRLEGHPMTLSAFAQRFRFHSIGGRDWLRIVSLFILGFLLTGPLVFTAQAIARIPTFSPPDFLPSVVNPLTPQTGQLTEFMGVSLFGNWWLAGIYFIFLTCFNIFCEELWFRGYILPRQELTHGRWTWLIHGILWTFFHVPVYPWYLIYLLPTALTVTFAAQYFRNTWASYAVHFLGNGVLVMIPIVIGIVRA
jgi:membrane protease YdiL (CAAX protease family)